MYKISIMYIKHPINAFKEWPSWRSSSESQQSCQPLPHPGRWCTSSELYRSAISVVTDSASGAAGFSFISDQNARKKGQFLHFPIENRRKRGEKLTSASMRSSPPAENPPIGWFGAPTAEAVAPGPAPDLGEIDPDPDAGPLIACFAGLLPQAVCQSKPRHHTQRRYECAACGDLE
jgi:hypothetical protein